MVAAILAVALFAAACGSSSSPSSAGTSQAASSAGSSSGTSTATQSGASAPAVADLGAAQKPTTSQFPAATGKSLKQLGTLARSSVELGAATGTFTPGTNRFAFALTTQAGKFVYAPTAIYVASSPSAPAKGPYLAPADPMGVQAQFRSKQNSGHSEKI